MVDTQETVRQPVIFSYRFEQDSALGQPGVSCALFVTGDESYSRRIRIRLSASKIFSVNARDAGGKTVKMPEHAGASILFSADWDNSLRADFPTAVAFESGARRLIRGGTWDRHKMSAGPAPAWQTLWKIEESELDQILDSLRSAQFGVKVGYWLDNRKIVFSNTAPADLGALGKFKDCITTNEIFKDRR